MWRAYLNIAISRAGDKVLLHGVKGQTLDGTVVRLEGVSELSLAHVKDGDVAAFSGGDEHLVLGRIQDGRGAVGVAVEGCKEGR